MAVEAPFLDQVVRPGFQVAGEDSASATRPVHTRQELGSSAADRGASGGAFRGVHIEDHAGDAVKHADENMGPLAAGAAIDKS